MKIQSRFTKIAVASGLIVATGAAVLGITGFASAQVAQRSNVVAVAQATETTLPANAATGTTPAAPTANPQAATPSSSATPATPSVAKADRPSPLATVSKALGITEAELKTELQAGKSIADVAKAKNIDIATVKAALLAEAKAHIDAEVAAGKHTAAEGAAKLAEKTSRIDTMLTTAGLPARGPQGMGGHKGKGGGKFMSATLATTLKLTQEELKTQLHSGKSLADVAKAQSVDIADVKATLTSDFSAHLAEEVTSGEHTQAEADAKLAEFKTNLDTMVNRVGPAGGMKGEGRGPGGRRGHGPMGQGAPSAQNTSASA